jgi:hypothetical protein
MLAIVAQAWCQNVRKFEHVLEVMILSMDPSQALLGPTCSTRQDTQTNGRTFQTKQLHGLYTLHRHRWYLSLLHSN